jgi:hypothetical protein
MASSKQLIQAAAGVSTGPEGAWDLSYAYYDDPFAGDVSSASHIASFSVSVDGVPEDVHFKPDGTKMYFIGAGSDLVREYNLSTAWSVSTASFNQSFSVATQEDIPRGLFFKTDGTKMYVAGDRGNDINEYNLSTAWDISTASYNQNLAAGDASPGGLYFRSDGLKMYMMGNSARVVREWTLSTAWDISTATYIQNFSVSSQDTNPRGLHFNSDGTKMYGCGLGSGRTVYQYNLSTAWDISTASYSQNISVDGIEAEAQGLYFRSDNAKMYVIGYGNKVVAEFGLGGFSVVAQTGTDSTGFFFKDDGSKMYVLGQTGSPLDAVHEYTIGKVAPFSVANKAATPTGVTFKSDGTEMYVVGASSDSVHQYSLSTAWDITSASFLQTFSVSAQEALPFEVVFKTDGTKMYITGLIGQDINEYNLSTAWDISTASYNQNFVPSGQLTEPASVFFKSDGTKMYILASGAGELDVNEYNLSTAWDISTSSFSQAFDISSQDTSPQGLSFKSDGTKMYMLGATGDDVNEYSLSTAWDISTASYSHNFSVSSQDTLPSGITFKSDGTKMYMVGRGTSDAVHEYDLSTAWDVSTASPAENSDQYWDLSAAEFSKSFSVATQENAPTAVFFKSDGTKMYVIGTTGDDVNEYNLSTAWDVSTSTYSQNFSFAAQETNPRGIYFKDDGTKMYISGVGSNAVNEYNLSTAWDVATASYSQNFSVSTQDTNNRGLFFKSDGSKMYIGGTTGDAVYEYDLSTSWDVSSASYVQNFSVAGQETNPQAVFFHPDGTQMFVTGQATEAVYTYSIGVQE